MPSPPAQANARPAYGIKSSPMNSSFKERIVSWAVPFVLASVLIVLANLQYHWSSEVSAATRTRLRADLQISLMDFREDLNRELTTMCLELQLDGGASARQAKVLADKLHHWERTASYPGLVANVYLWQAPRHGGSEEEDPSLLRLFPDEGRLRVIAWPASLHSVRQLLAQNVFGTFSDRPPPKPAKKPLPKAISSGLLFSPPSPFDLPGDPAIFPMPGLMDQSIPMLIFPASRVPPHDIEPGPVGSWLLVELDANFLRSQVFPKLVSRYFGDPRTSDYGVAIVGGSDDKPQVMYSSDTGFSEYKQTPVDGRLNLFGPPSSDDGPGAPPRPARFRLFRDAGHARIGQPSAGPRTGALPSATQRRHGMIESMRFDPVHLRPGDRDWQVVVRNRKGSVEVAVQELRRRDLAVSFGVLLTLAATMALIIFTSQRARRLATLQMDFVAGVSHELRTPIAAILSASENMVDGVVESKQQMIRYGGIITAQAKRLNQLVEQVLRFSAMRAKTPNYHLRPLAISEVITRTLENTASIVQPAGVEVECQIEPNLPPVAADFEALSQCLQNLITNAVKYGGEGKWMGISAHLVNFDGRPSEIQITVKDRGIGIGREEMKQIFDPFYRSPRVSASPIHGSGLGLSLAKSFAEAIGGRITTHSEVGQGSAFTVHLSVTTQQEQVQNAVVEMSPNSSST
jgi:two-component system, OmpR family, sensor histidine kinase SenX3